MSTPDASPPPADAASAHWVDLHNHLLPGLDDGPADWPAALDLCRALVADGVTHAAATPHLYGPYTEPDRVEIIRFRTTQLVRRLAEEQIPLVIYPGADVRIDAQLAEALPQGKVPTLGRGGSHVLVEPPHDVWIDAPAVCDLLDAAGCVGVLTHPERHRHVQRHGLEVVQPWVDRGAILQITAGSLLGDFGAPARELAWQAIASPVPAIVASDAHNLHQRPPRIGVAAELIAARLGRPAALRLCRDFPLALVADALPATTSDQDAAPSLAPRSPAGIPEVLSSAPSSPATPSTPRKRGSSQDTLPLQRESSPHSSTDSNPGVPA